MLSTTVVIGKDNIKIEKEKEKIADTSATEVQPAIDGVPSFYDMEESSYEWIDGVTGGSIGPSGDDTASNAIDIGFDFPFFGISYSQLWFSTNGLISFDGPVTSFSNIYIPNSNIPNNFVAAYWDDLYIYSDSATYYRFDSLSSPRRFIITWYNVGRCCSASNRRTTLEAILYEDGKILFQYKKPSNFEYNDSATVGIENKVGIIGRQYRYNEPVGDFSGVTFSPQVDLKAKWSAVGPTGAVDEGDINIFAFDGKPSVYIKSLATLPAALDIRYNVVAVNGLLKGNSPQLTMRYIDNGADARVWADLVEYDMNIGVKTNKIRFDSNNYPQQKGYQMRTVDTCNPGWTFDFTNKIYWVIVHLEKTGSAGTPELSGVQLVQDICWN